MGEPIPEWAMQKAAELDLRWNNDTFWTIIIARALAETAERLERETIERCAKIARDGCLVPPDGGSPTEAETTMCNGIATAIRSLPAKYGKAKT